MWLDQTSLGAICDSCILDSQTAKHRFVFDSEESIDGDRNAVKELQ